MAKFELVHSVVFGGGEESSEVNLSDYVQWLERHHYISQLTISL